MMLFALSFLLIICRIKKMLKRNRMDTSLSTVLQSFRIAAGDKNYTHTSRIEPKGTFYIGGKDDLKKFYSELCKANERNECYGITERPLEISPLRQDFDFRFSLDHGCKRVYSLEDLKRLHRIYCEVLKGAISEDAFEEKMMICIISEKSKPRSEGGVIKDGLHLFFPYVYVDGWFLDTYVPDQVTKLMKREKLWAYEKYMEPIDELIDRTLRKKVWMLYGSVSSPMSEYYKVTHIFDGKQNEITLEEAFPNFFRGERKKEASYYLPMLMSIRKEHPKTPLNEIVEAKKKALINEQASKKRKYKRVVGKRSEVEVLEDLKRIEGDIMDMLSDDRCDKWESWMDVGWTLHSISQGNEKGLDMWIQFSKRSPKFKLGECEERWDKMDGRVGQNGQPKTIGSILRMARLDNPDAYNEWRESNVEVVIEDSLRAPKPNHYDLAMVLYKCFEDRFICSNSKRDMWFEYRNHAWHYVDDGISIKRLLPTIIAQKYGAFQRKLSEQFDRAVNSQQTSLAKEIQDKMKKVWKVIDFVKNKSNIVSCVEVAKMLFYKEDFHKTLDANCWLIGDQNGVYDLKNGIHRDGSPDDCISKQMGVEYIEYTWDDPEVVTAMHFFKQVFPNERIRTYFLKSTSACMQAGNVNKKFYVWTDERGNNAKSITLKAMQFIFGEYFMTFDPARFMKNTVKSAGGPMPDLKRMIARRIGAVKELAKNQPVDIGFLKFITGMDSMYVRSHHEEGDDITPQLTLVIMCNKPPKIPDDDEATWNRACVIPFEAIFSDNAPEDEDEQFRQKHFPIDRNFANKLPDMINAMYWILLQYFKMYLKDGLTPPPEVVLDTEKYKTDNNVFMQFINDKIKKTGNETNSIHFREMKAEFKEWYDENYPSYKFKYGDNTLKHELAKSPIGAIGKANRWYGMVIKTDEDDGEESMDLSGDENEE